MKVTVTFMDNARRTAAINVRPSLLDRLLLGARELQDMACAAVHDDGGRLWLWDSTGRRITNRRIVATIERSRRLVEAAHRREVTT